MTDNEWINEIIGALDCVGGIGPRSEVLKIIQRIRRIEAERCAAVVRNANECDFNEHIADKILATSPGKETPKLDQQAISEALGSTMIEGEGVPPRFGRFGLQQYVAGTRDRKAATPGKAEQSTQKEQ